MDVNMFSEWLGSCSVPERITALSLIYSRITIHTRQLFLPEAEGKEKRVLEVLHGLNEVHHTVSSWLVDYVTDESKAFPVEVLAQQLREIEERYRLQKFLTPAIDAVRDVIGRGPRGTIA